MFWSKFVRSPLYSRLTANSAHPVMPAGSWWATQAPRAIISFFSITNIGESLKDNVSIMLSPQFATHHRIHK